MSMEAASRLGVDPRSPASQVSGTPETCINHPKNACKCLHPPAARHPVFFLSCCEGWGVLRRRRELSRDPKPKLEHLTRSLCTITTPQSETWGSVGLRPNEGGFGILSWRGRENSCPLRREPIKYYLPFLRVAGSRVEFSFGAFLVCLLPPRHTHAQDTEG